MAECEEQSPTTESLPEVDSDDEKQTNYKVPAKKTIEELQNLDAEDESLRKYKETLLGSGVKGSTGEKTKLTVLSMTLVPADHEETTVSLKDLVAKEKGKDAKEKGKLDTDFVLKEGTNYKVKFEFIIENDLMSGLKYQQLSYRKGIKVDKFNVMLGSYGPKDEPYTFLTLEQEAPSGMMARGSYKVNSKFIDDDKEKHLEFEWHLKIQKDWKKE